MIRNTKWQPPRNGDPEYKVAAAADLNKNRMRKRKTLLGLGIACACMMIPAVCVCAKENDTTLVYGSGDYTRINPAMDEHGEINILLFDGLTAHDGDNQVVPRTCQQLGF